MRKIIDQMGSKGPTGFGSAALSMIAKATQDTLSLDRNEVREGRERREGTEISSGRNGRR